MGVCCAALPVRGGPCALALPTPPGHPQWRDVMLTPPGCHSPKLLQEPEFFTDDCQHDPLNCPLDKQRDYIQQVGGCCKERTPPRLGDGLGSLRLQLAGSLVCRCPAHALSPKRCRRCSWHWPLPCQSAPLPPPSPTSPHPPLRLQTLHINRVLRHNAYRAMFEGSTHYGREGPRIAQGLREVSSTTTVFPGLGLHNGTAAACQHKPWARSAAQALDWEPRGWHRRPRT